tara:strand:+ start:32428 stop:33021 length:594 start_codon:yes stop_codon:yes gene_type:complete
VKLLFATKNLNKANEIKDILPKQIQIITLKDIGLEEDIPETSKTIRGNALQKVNFIKNHFKINCFAEDSGLEIDSLNGEPGVDSAIYAGKHRDDNDNINLVLKKLKSKANRKAQFKTIIALKINENIFEFEGVVNGTILLNRRGKNGFGYDSIFEPENCCKTFAEMNIHEKNYYSHRSKAANKMITFLEKTINLSNT